MTQATYSIKHLTSFRYSPPVGETLMEVRLQPRSDTQQRCLAFSLEVSPKTNVMSYRDFYGNAVHHFDIPGRHDAVQVMTESTVEKLPRRSLADFPQSTWDELDELVFQGDYWEMLLPGQFTQPTPKLEKLRAELQVERTGDPLTLVKQLTATLYDAFDYDPNATRVDSPIDDALEARSGVCQDFAHIMIVLVRKLKIPCRYVSGYLYHEDKCHDRSPASASHAWIEAYLGAPGWVEFDPTNNLMGCERHIRVAVGRDYADVPPTRGVHRGEAESELAVKVHLSSIDAPKPEDLAPAMVLRSKRRPNATTLNFDPSQSQQQQQQ